MMERLSIKGGTFPPQNDAIEVVIVNAAKVSRAYFKDKFDSSKTTETSTSLASAISSTLVNFNSDTLGQFEGVFEWS